MPLASEPAHTHGTPTKTAILLCNLGTPDAPTPSALRRYLGQFLSDTRVVEIPHLIWKPILHAIILRVRPAKSAAKQVWWSFRKPVTADQRDLQPELAHGGIVLGPDPLDCHEANVAAMLSEFGRRHRIEAPAHHRLPDATVTNLEVWLDARLGGRCDCA